MKPVEVWELKRFVKLPTGLRRGGSFELRKLGARFLRDIGGSDVLFC